MLYMSLNDAMFNLKDVDSKIMSKHELSELLGIPYTDFYLLCNGKIINDLQNVGETPIHIVSRLPGGKGGFGSMLRAIGAQIEKTTNREACRDLSGRRLRDINEEKRLKNWINQQSEREKQADDRRQKKIERLCQKPKHEFKDEAYDKERSALPEKVEDALAQGLKASCSSGSAKRKQVEPKQKKKKARIWVGSEDELSSSIDSEEEETPKPSSSKDFDSEESNKGTDCTPQISEQNSKLNSDEESNKSIEIQESENEITLAQDFDSDESNKGTDCTPQISEPNSNYNSDDETKKPVEENGEMKDKNGEQIEDEINKIGVKQ